MEPEHSSDYPLQKIEIMMPQLFNQRSILSHDSLAISEVYFEEHSDLIKELMEVFGHIDFKNI